ncbi:hypothetical protein PENANT_c019G00318 [Penicillium antarcticum]|uniref:Uncharacterized protein n=1 Tax=Penicillium antarcticum TaxID=416450 RepID=A0A1V6Q156_9EURO|nr:uncharacterized protein N7508_001191 [Penicillium antarcticum]KAJ5316683.1 hypothetical protein N7508_001191 [Penicillium antarcticum]OQD82959.1 hypothetical protein PENANT_c019G00318 [Penicillium antarcticum]
MQGFNMGRYVPPDQEGVLSGNQLAKKHPLGARARHPGALVVRFEMPFAVWCTTCKPHDTIIGQGVRFNAEKRKVGNYYSTPIYSFRMKHTVCGGTIEIKTDPQHTAYVVTQGGKKRDTGEDKELQPGEIAIKPYALGQDPAEKDPFSKLEGKVEDKRRAKTEATRILEIQERQNRDWEDPYEKSMRLRRTFRQERKGLEKAEAGREALKDKMSLGIDLMDETESDQQRAQMVDFGDDQATVGAHAARATRTRPMFAHRVAKYTTKTNSHDTKSRALKRAKAANLAASRKASLRNELSGNTRATVDPFLIDDTDDPSGWQPGKKRKSAAPSTSTPRSITPSIDSPNMREKRDATPKDIPTPAATPVLVGYPSDSD